MLPILTVPNPTLRLLSKGPIKPTKRLVALAGAMMTTMVDNRGIGLAAIQVGYPLPIITIDTSKVESSGIIAVMFNPIIIAKEGSASIAEGCLSIPNEQIEVDRAAKIVVQYNDIMNNTVTKELIGITAICVQHEIDHLSGILLTDYKKVV